ncbi:MBL fold metallo-hydrolase, partial [Streptomyces sp. SID4917]
MNSGAARRDLGAEPGGLRRIVLTHCHRAHVGAAGELAGRFGAEVLAHRLDAPVVRGDAPVPEPVPLNGEIPLYEHGLTLPVAPPTRADRELEDGDELDFGDGARVVHAPGHTGGSIAVHLPHHGVLFVGEGGPVCLPGPVAGGQRRSRTAQDGPNSRTESRSWSADRDAVLQVEHRPALPRAQRPAQPLVPGRRQ